MIRIRDGLWLAADEISEVAVNEAAGTVTVRTIRGIGHQLELYPNEKPIVGAERIVAAIEWGE